MTCKMQHPSPHSQSASCHARRHRQFLSRRTFFLFPLTTFLSTTMISNFIFYANSSSKFRADMQQDLASLPYQNQKHGPLLSHREIRATFDGNDSSVTFTPNASDLRFNPSYMGHVTTEAFLFNKPYTSSTLSGHILKATNPVHTFSVYEPGEEGGCVHAADGLGVDGRATVQESARHYGCLAAVNAGFFNTTSGECHGNLVSNARIVRKDGPANVQFGLRRDGTIFVGYIDDNTIGSPINPFLQLVAGVLWLVRDGENYVSESLTREYGGTQQGSDLRGFASLISARVALGHDADGNILALQLDGESWARGLALTDFADLLIDHGFVNAINLDGGGSSTTVINGTVTSLLSDQCYKEGGVWGNMSQCTDCPFADGSGDNLFQNCDSWCKQYKCARPVTTIVCFHEPICWKWGHMTGHLGVKPTSCDTPTIPPTSTTAQPNVVYVTKEANESTLVKRYRNAFFLCLALLVAAVGSNCVLLGRSFCHTRRQQRWEALADADEDDDEAMDREYMLGAAALHDTHEKFAASAHQSSRYAAAATVESGAQRAGGPRRLQPPGRKSHRLGAWGSGSLYERLEMDDLGAHNLSRDDDIVTASAAIPSAQGINNPLAAAIVSGTNTARIAAVDVDRDILVRDSAHGAVDTSNEDALGEEHGQKDGKNDDIIQVMAGLYDIHTDSDDDEFHIG
eukprot:m.508784 g.508784  ORF g.508784 m.508784 type:complete len:685 (+) comp21886_c0_seq3:240-2294(+)